MFDNDVSKYEIEKLMKIISELNESIRRVALIAQTLESTHQHLYGTSSPTAQQIFKAIN